MRVPRALDGGVASARASLLTLRVMLDSGVLRPSRPDRLLASLAALRRWGVSLPGVVSASAARHPEEVAIVDERERLTFRELDRRSTRLARTLHDAGVREGTRAALLCRNHAGFVVWLAALTRTGADVLLLNTGFAAPQVADVIEREGVSAVVHDAELSTAVGDVLPAARRFIVDADSSPASGQAPDGGRDGIVELRPPAEPSRITVLTSGTTGAPKGARRGHPRGAAPLVGVLSRLPLRSRETTFIAAPLFHFWGLAHLGLALTLSSTVVLQRRFDARSVMSAIDRERVSALIAVPTMLRRILDLPQPVLRGFDISSLRVVAVSGSTLSPELANAFMDQCGDVLFNLYGSTEVATATIATPDDLRRAPGTVGRPPHGTALRLLDDRGREVPAGERGRIFVGNDLLFEGYTQGDGALTVDGLVSTGDVGRLDPEGRLFIEGRSDDMIVSGGENVFPDEVEHLLLAHQEVRDAAVVGVVDQEFGSRLRAYVVPRPGAALTADAVRDHVRSNLARFKVPRDVLFVAEIPRNQTGKIDRAALQQEERPAEPPRG